MSSRKVEADCPGCHSKVGFTVDLPDPQVSVVEDPTKVAAITRERDEAIQELARWQAMEKHPPVPQILEHLGTCPNCKPHMDEFLGKFASGLPVEQVKNLARQHKLWPPPEIDLGPLTRKARA